MRKFVFLILLTCVYVNLHAVDIQSDSSIIKGKVTDLNGNALPGTVITIENTHTGVYTDSNGSYSFSGLKDGNYTMRFSFIGYETQLIKVKLKEEAVVNYDG
jgi:iron complex outermembrane receptor protein